MNLNPTDLPKSANPTLITTFVILCSCILFLAAPALAQADFEGLTHLPLGNATLVNGADGLVVSGIGSSGLDGVAIDLTENEGWHMDAMIADPQEVHAVFRGAIAGQPNLELVNHHALRQSDGTYNLTVDFTAVGAATNRWEYFLNGQLVRTDTGVPFDLPSVAKQYPLGNDLYYVDSCCPGEFDHISLSGLVTLVYITKSQADSIEIVVDRIDVYPENPQFEPSAPSLVELTVGGTPEFRIIREQVLEFGNLHQALGEVTYVASSTPPELAVCCLGSSGADGVEVEVGQAASAQLVWETIDPSGVAPVNAFLKCAARGRFEGVDGENLGWQRYTNDGSGALAITADLSGIGSETQTIQVLSGGTLVYEATGQSGNVGSVGFWPSGCGKLGGSTPCLWGGWPFPVSFDIAGSNVVGDELRILAEGVSAPIEHISHLTVTGADLGELVITSETTSSAGLSPVPDETGDGSLAPKVAVWHHAAPNPFNPRTDLSFSLTTAAKTELRIYDARGRLIRTLVAATLAAGEHHIPWDGTGTDGRRMPTGLYMSELRAGTDIVRTKLMLIK